MPTATITATDIEDTILAGVDGSYVIYRDRNFGAWGHNQIYIGSYYSQILTRFDATKIPDGEITGGRLWLRPKTILGTDTTVAAYAVKDANDWVQGTGNNTVVTGASCWNFCKTPTIAADQLTDGDMELANTTYWPCVEGVTTKQTTSPHGGSRLLRVTAAAAAGGKIPRAYQSQTTVGKTYRVQGWARSDGTQLPAVNCWLAYTATPHWVGTNSTSWQYFDFTYTADGTWFRLQLNINNPAGTEYVEFDDVTLTEITDTQDWAGGYASGCSVSGTDFDANASPSEMTIPAGSTTFNSVELDPTWLEDWRDGNRTNNGIVLIQTSPPGAAMNFGKTVDTVDWQPYFEIDYVAPVVGVPRTTPTSSPRLENEDRGVLTFRPNIAFVEPDQEPGTVEGVDTVQAEDVEQGRARIKKLAEAVNTLATATQARVDQRASGMVIELDKNADQDTIQAMRRRYPDADPTKITYEQYRECKNGIIGRGVDIAGQGLVTNEDVQSATESLNGNAGLGSGVAFSPGGFGTDTAKNGKLRPELNEAAQIIPPLDIEDLQINLICILVNFIWKNFIKKVVVNSSPWPVKEAFKLLPDELCDPGADIDIPGLAILGDPPSDLLTGKVAEKAKGEIS